MEWRMGKAGDNSAPARPARERRDPWGFLESVMVVHDMIRERELPSRRNERGHTLNTANTGPLAADAHRPLDGDDAIRIVQASLDEAKAEDVLTIDIRGKSALGDAMVIASGRSNRHVSSICDRLMRDMKAAGLGSPLVEGLENGDWVLMDAGDVIVHVFRPEVREFYNLERMWMMGDEETVH